MSLPQKHYCPHRIAVKFSRPRGNYRGYRGITSFQFPHYRVILYRTRG